MRSFARGAVLELAISAWLVGCGLFAEKKSEPTPPAPAPAASASGNWSGSIEGAPDYSAAAGAATENAYNAHADRIGAAQIDSLMMEGPSAAPKIAAFLTDPSEPVRRKASDCLIRLGPKGADGALAPMVEYLRNVDPGIRRVAARTLAGVASAKLESFLERSRNDPDAATRAWVLAALAAIEVDDCPELQAEVADLIRRASGLAPLECAEAFGRMRCVSPDALETLAAALQQGAEPVRGGAARALGSLGPAAAPALGQLMATLVDTKAPRARQEALLAVAKMGPKAAAAVPLLIGVLADPAPRFRELAAHALGSIGPAAVAAVKPLQQAEKDVEVTVQAAAKRALATIAPGESEGNKP